MMKVGLIADVHANLPALEAVLADMPRVDRIVCAGDVVGYNPWPAACLERVRDVASSVVRGNHDATVETPERYAANEMAEAGLRHARSVLDEEALTWLRELPRTDTFDDDGYLLVHSHPSPEHDGEYVHPPEFGSLVPYVTGYDGVVLGHTHVQGSVRLDDGCLVVNPGSVGQPRDGDPDAAYAVLDTSRNTVTERRVSYDIDRVARAVETIGLPSRTATRLYDGR